MVASVGRQLLCPIDTSVDGGISDTKAKHFICSVPTAFDIPRGCIHPRHVGRPPRPKDRKRIGKCTRGSGFNSSDFGSRHW